MLHDCEINLSHLLKEVNLPESEWLLGHIYL